MKNKILTTVLSFIKYYYNEYIEVIERKIMERQSHGKIFENFMKEKVYGIKKEIKHTEKWDFIKEEYFSIKTTKNNNIAMGDCKRIISIDKDFVLIVGRYKQEKTKKIIREVFVFNFPFKIFKKYITDKIDVNGINDFDEYIKKIPPFVDNVSYFRKKCREMKKSLKNESILVINPKIDSKKQRRLQCSLKMNHLLKLFDYEGLCVEVYNENNKKLNNVDIMIEI